MQAVPQNSASSEVQTALTFMFQDPQWQRKLLIGAGLMVASMVVPVIPLLFTAGYVYRIMERILREDGEPALPEWNEWTRLLLDGVRFLGALLLYALPAILLFIFGYGLMMLLPLIGAFITHANNQPVYFVVMQVGGMFFGFIMYALAMLFSLVASLFTPLALCNLAAKNRFMAAFEVKDWWRVLRANPGEYFLAWVITLGISFVILFVYQVLYLTIILCCLVPLFLVASSIYLSCVSNALFAMSYRVGMSKVSA